MPELFSDWTGTASAVAAWLAALFAYYSYRVSKRNVVFLENQLKAREPKIVPYLADGYSAVRKNGVSKNGKMRVYVFSVSLTNAADADNALTNIELLLTFYRSGQPLTTLVLPHIPTLGRDLGLHDTIPLSLPQKVGAHQAVAGWVFFAVDNDVLSGTLMDSYKIRFTDSHGSNSFLEPIIVNVRELIDEKALGKA